MKYIAVFDIPDGYGFGCATAKIAPKGKDIYEEKDFENAYAQIEPLSEEKAEILRALTQKVWPKLESGEMKVSIDRVFPIEQAADAHAVLERGENVGKVVLKVRE